MKPSFRENAWCPLTFRPEEGSSCEEARWVGANSLAADRRRPRAHCRQFPATPLMLSSTPSADQTVTAYTSLTRPTTGASLADPKVNPSGKGGPPRRKCRTHTRNPGVCNWSEGSATPRQGSTRPMRGDARMNQGSHGRGMGVSIGNVTPGHSARRPDRQRGGPFTTTRTPGVDCRAPCASGPHPRTRWAAPPAAASRTAGARGLIPRTRWLAPPGSNGLTLGRDHAHPRSITAHPCA